MSAVQTCGRCGSPIKWDGDKWTTADEPIGECLPGLGTEHRPAAPKQLTEDEWDDTYEPIPNPVDGSMIWDYSDRAQMDRLAEFPTDRLWTFVDCDGGQAIIPGLHFVNRVGYIVSERPWADESVEAFLPDVRDEDDE